MISVRISVASTRISVWQSPGAISALPTMASVRVERSVGSICLWFDLLSLADDLTPTIRCVTPRKLAQQGSRSHENRSGDGVDSEAIRKEVSHDTENPDCDGLIQCIRSHHKTLIPLSWFSWRCGSRPPQSAPKTSDGNPSNRKKI
jgi:hypothetical protein